MVKAIAYLSKAAAAVIRVVRRERVDIQHGYMGPDETRAIMFRRVPPSSPTTDHRHPLATPYIERIYIERTYLLFNLLLQYLF